MAEAAQISPRGRAPTAARVYKAAMSGQADATSDGVAVRLGDVRKTYGDVVAVDRVDLEIATDEFFTMLGPSGSGKTTCLRMIAGFERPDEGVIELGGRDVTDVPPYDRDVNTVFQDYALFPHMTVGENVEYGLQIKGVAEGRAPPRGPPRRSRWCGSAATRIAARASSRAASASAWPWPARS